MSYFIHDILGSEVANEANMGIADSFTEGTG